MQTSDKKIVDNAITKLKCLSSPKHWLSTSRLASSLQVEPGDLERALQAHAERPDWKVPYSYYPSGRSLERLWGHKSKVGKQGTLPPVERQDHPEEGDIGPDNFDSWIFISHNERDEDKVRRVAEIVQSCGFGPWIFQQQIMWGDPIFESVRAAIDDCKHFIVFVSANSLPSLWVEKELRVHFRLAQQDLEKETIVVADDNDPRFVPALEAAIEGEVSSMLKLVNLPAPRQNARAEQMLTSLGTNEKLIHFVGYSEMASTLEMTLRRLADKHEEIVANITRTPTSDRHG
ncbi:MAG: toll/interleukin-1 receptor domain-containing protein [Chromatiales bacterium]|jgi:hypothetical protein